MRSLELDDMPIREVLDLARTGPNVDYWRMIVRIKLREYRQTMPKMEIFVDIDWRANYDGWMNELKMIESK